MEAIINQNNLSADFQPGSFYIGFFETNHGSGIKNFGEYNLIAPRMSHNSPSKRNISSITNMWGSQIRAINIPSFIFSVAVGLVRVIGWNLVPHMAVNLLFILSHILSYNGTLIKT